MQNKGGGTNSFNGGLNTDGHPLVVKNSEMIDALNAEIMTVGENQYVLKNIPGDTLDVENGKGFKLTEGFIPLAVKSYNNVGYIISGKFDSEGNFKAGELGTYPSPDWAKYGVYSGGFGVPFLNENYKFKGILQLSNLEYPYKMVVSKEFELTDEAIGRSVYLKFYIKDTTIFKVFDRIKLYASNSKGDCEEIYNYTIIDNDAREGNLYEVSLHNITSKYVTITAEFFVSKAYPEGNLSNKYLTPCTFEVREDKTVSYITTLKNHYKIARDTISRVNNVQLNPTEPEVTEFFEKIKDSFASLDTFPSKTMDEYYVELANQMNFWEEDRTDMQVIDEEFFNLKEFEYIVQEEGDLTDNVTTELKNVYSPIHNFLTEEYEAISECDFVADPWERDECHIKPFRTKELAFNINDFIDLTLQKEYDESINFIFTDDRNPVRLLNSRFKLNEDGTATIIDRRQSKDTNTYSTKFFDQTELILKSSLIATLDFLGVHSGGKLKGGGYKYFFRHKNADGNISDLIAESSLVSVHFGIGESAYGVAGDKDTDKLVKFKLSGLEITSGTIEVTVNHISGDSNPVANTFKLKENYFINSEGECNIEHSGIEEIELVDESEVNTSFSSIEKVKTLDQINNRLVLGNVTSSIDATLFKELEEVSRLLRIGENITSITSGYNDPNNVYFNLGYWAGETYEIGIVYVLKKGGLTPVFPVRGLDNYKGTGVYSGDLNLSEDIEIENATGIVSLEHKMRIPNINEFENVRGLYRTFHDKELVINGIRQVTKLSLNMGRLINSPKYGYLKDNVTGYFIVRKDRKKDTLYQGYISPTAMMPIGNIESTVGSYDFISFKRNTAVHPLKTVVADTDGSGVIDSDKFYLGFDNGELSPLLEKSSDLEHNLYSLVMGHVPQYADAVPLVHPGGDTILSEVGRVPRTNKVAFYSGDMEVDLINVTSILNNSRLNLNINLAEKVSLSKMLKGERIQSMVSESSTIDLNIPPTIKNTVGEIQGIGDMVFIPGGSIVAAEGEFTAKIDRTMNFLHTSVSGGSPTINYKHRDGFKDRNPSSGMIYIEYMYSGDNPVMKIHYTDVAGKDRTSYVKALKKGDTVRVPFHPRDYVIKSNPNKKSSWAEFEVDTAKGIAPDWAKRQVVFIYADANHLKFFPVIFPMTDMSARGFDSSDISDSIDLWGEGIIGINKTALWEIKSNSADKEKLYPYASVCNNYSNYVGIKLSLSKDYKYSFLAGSSSSPSTGQMNVQYDSVSGESTISFGYIAENGRNFVDEAMKLGSGDIITISKGLDTIEFSLNEDPVKDYPIVSMITSELSTSPGSTPTIGDRYLVSWGDKGDIPFEHDQGGNFLYLAEIKESFNELTSANLIEIYSTQNSRPYYSITDRIKLDSTDEVSIANGDCFITKTFKKTTYAIGIQDAPSANFGDFYTYGSGPQVEWDKKADKDLATSWMASQSSETMDEGRKLSSNGMVVELISQTNHNSDIRSFEPSQPLEKMLYGSDRGFYPKVNVSKSYSEYRPDSTAYNRGYTGDYNVVSYVGIDIEAPIYTLNYPNRIMISSPNIQSEFFNGYRDISGINFKDYNSELGQIIKLINHNNILFCVFENGIAAITVDGRTLINQQSDIYIDDAQVLASKAVVLNSKIGSTNPESIISTYNTVYGVDFIRNKVWRISGESVEVLSDYKIEQYLINAKKHLIDITDSSGENTRGKPRIYSSFDAIKKNVYFTYNKLLNNKSDGFFDTFGSVYYNEVMGAWTSRTSYSPKFQLVNNEFNMIFDVNNLPGEAWMTGVNSKYCNFHGIQYPFHVEFIMHERPDIEKILTNLQILSNKVKPDEITYSTTSDVPNAALRQNIVNYYDSDGNLVITPGGEDYINTENTFNTVHIDKIFIREDSLDMSIGIFKENAYYKDGKYFVQVGKSDSFSRFNKSSKRIRDKYFKIRIKYTGEDYTYLYSVISLFTNNYD